MCNTTAKWPKYASNIGNKLLYIRMHKQYIKVPLVKKCTACSKSAIILIFLKQKNPD